MQRKNRVLNRSGVAMIMAIAVIVILSTLMALALSLSKQNTKKTIDLYLVEQARILALGSAEYAMLVITESDPCSVKELNFNGPENLDYYDINITFNYVYGSNEVCDNGGGNNYFVVNNPEQNGSVMMDIEVSIPASKNITSEPIRITRRIIQKI